MTLLSSSPTGTIKEGVLCDGVRLGCSYNVRAGQCGAQGFAAGVFEFRIKLGERVGIFNSDDERLRTPAA